MRGFLSGMFWGLAVAVVGLSAVSLMAPQPAGNRPPEAPQVESPEAAQGETETVPEAGAPAAQDAPAVAAAEGPAVPEEEGALPAADTAPAEVPALADAAEDLGAPPEAGGDAADVVGVATDGAAVTGVPAPAPVVPALEAEVEASTVPAEPLAEVAAPVAEVAVVEAPPATAAEPAAPDAGPVAVEADDALPTAEVAEPLQPEGVAEVPAAPAIAAETEPSVPVEVQEMQPPLADAGVEVAETGLPQVDEVAPIVPAPDEGGFDLPQVGVEPEAGEAAPLPEAEETEVLPGVNGEVGLPGGASGVRVNRPEAGAVAEEAPAGRQALREFAAEWVPAGDLPQMGIVLVDDGTLAGATAAVAALPVPVTVAIDPGAAGAGAVMAEYRAAGIEVLALSRLPVGAAPTDVAVTFEAVFALLPEALGVIDTGAGGLQENSAVTEQAMARLAADGRGAVVPGGGLNMAARAAAEAGVPLGTIYRDIDGGDEDAAAIRRMLDQAAFRARQESGVILLGRVRAETLSALMLWRSANGVDEVEVAPVSAILLAGE